MDFDRLRFVSERADATETPLSVNIPERYSWLDLGHFLLDFGHFLRLCQLYVTWLAPGGGKGKNTPLSAL